MKAPYPAQPRRRVQQVQTDQSTLADQLAALDAHLLGTLPPFLRQALQRERRRLLVEQQAEGGQAR